MSDVANIIAIAGLIFMFVVWAKVLFNPPSGFVNSMAKVRIVLYGSAAIALSCLLAHHYLIKQ